MMNLFEMMQAAQGGNAIRNLSSQFGLSQAQTENAITALLPALSMGLQRQAQSPDMLSNLAGMMMGAPHARAFDSDGDGIPDSVQSSGNDVLEQLFGSKQVTRAVAAQAEAASGIGASILKQMLPVIASMVMGGLFKSAANQGLGGILGQLAGMAGGAMPGGALPGSRGAAPQPGDNPLGDILGGLLGGNAAGGAGGGFGGGLGDILGKMMGAGQPAPQPGPQADFDPAAFGLDALTKMFETGAKVQQDHQDGLKSIFDAMVGGARR